jgi:hypothetical protein
VTTPIRSHRSPPPDNSNGAAPQNTGQFLRQILTRNPRDRSPAYVTAFLQEKRLEVFETERAQQLRVTQTRMRVQRKVQTVNGQVVGSDGPFWPDLLSPGAHENRDRGGFQRGPKIFATPY